MKPPTDLHTDYLQPPETSSPSLKSPLELLANACNKLETDMMNIRPDSGRKLSSPNNVSSHVPHVSSHLPQLRLAPTRHNSEPITLVRPSSTSSSSSAVSSLSSGVSMTNTTPAHAAPAKSPLSKPSLDSVTKSPSPVKSVSEEHSSSEPLSLVNKPKSPETPENLTRKAETEQRPGKVSPVMPRPEVGSIRVRPAETLSPAGQPPLKKPRESPSPRLSHRPPSASPVPQSTSSPRPPATSLPSLPPGFPPGLASTLPGMIPSSLASLYSPYTSPYLAGLGGGLGGIPPTTPGAPCTDPMCRDPACPTYQLRAAQTAQLMALSGMSGYPGYPPMLPGMPGLPPSMIPGFPGATPPSLPGMLPPSLLAPPAPSSSLPSVTSSASLPTVGGASQFMCSWMQGRDFCGRRFNSSEELMSHLRTHTANMGDTPSPAGPAATPPAAAPPAPNSALALLQAQAAQLRSQVSPQATPSTLSPPGLASADPRLAPYLRPGLTPPNPSLNPMLASLYGSPRQLPVLP